MVPFFHCSTRLSRLRRQDFKENTLARQGRRRKKAAASMYIRMALGFCLAWHYTPYIPYIFRVYSVYISQFGGCEGNCLALQLS
jgi:hypothetical protein